MTENFFSYASAWVAVLGMLVFFIVFLYLLLFEAEKIRLKMVALPEYKSSWVFLVKSYEPFKWWHFYRRGAFIYLINPVIISGRQQRASVAAKKIVEIIPNYVKKLYQVDFLALMIFMAAGGVSYFLH